MDQPSSTSEIASAQATAANADSSQEVAPDDECVRRMELRVYNAAKKGDTAVLGLHGERLSEILTPTENTVLHIYIACVIKSQADDDSTNVVTVREILRMCPALLLQPNKRGDTILHMAARHGHDDIVQYLIDAARDRQEEACCQLLITNDDRDTALHEAVRFNHLAVVRILTGADPDALYSANVAGETPLYMAAERGYIGVVFEILKTCTGPTYQGPDGRTALHAAVIYNDHQMTSKLLNHERALTKVVDERGWTPLHYAAFFGHSSMVKQLLGSDESAAYVRDKDDKRTPLHVAASKGHLDVIEVLISHCPDCCELVDKRHRNILHYATEQGHSKMIEFIRTNRWLSNVLLNGKDEEHNTPLHQLVASLYNNQPMVRDINPIVETGFHFVRDARVDKMAFNKKNLNAFDIILANGAFSAEVEKKLKTIFEKNGTRPGHRIGGNKDGRGNKGEDDPEFPTLMTELKNAHLVVATLIATVAFTAGTNESQKKLKQKYAPQIFAWANTAAMTLSSLAVFLHFYVILTASKGVIYRQFKWVLCLTMSALFCMLVAFFCGQYTAVPSGLGRLVCLGGIFLLLWFTTHSLISLTRGSLSDPLKKPLRIVTRQEMLILWRKTFTQKFYLLKFLSP